MKQRLRILCCGSSMVGGGSERQLLYLLQSLDRSQFEPYLYLLYPEGPLLSSLPDDVPQTSFWGTRTLPRLNWPGRFHRQQVRDLAAVIDRWNIDITYDRLFHMAMINGPASSARRCPRLSTIVSPPSRDLPNAEKRFVWLKRRLLARAYRQADRLLAVSSSTADDAARFYNIPRRQFEIVPSAVDLARIDVLQSQRTLPLSRESFHIIAIGRLSREKNHSSLLEGFSRFVQHSQTASQLHVVGDGPLRQQLESQASQLGIAARTHFYGHLDNPYSLLAQGDLLVLPSQYEGMPNVVIEGMACRIPVLAAATAGAARELLGDGVRGTVIDVPDAEGIASALIDRWRCPSPWLHRIDAARAYVEQHHNLPRWIQTMEAMFVETVQRQRRS